MSEKPSRKFHVLPWVVTLLVVPLLYLLSCSPLYCFTASVTGSRNPPLWLQAYQAPALWVYWNTPLTGPMQAYADWWFDWTQRYLRKGPRPPRGFDSALY